MCSRSRSWWRNWSLLFHFSKFPSSSLTPFLFPYFRQQHLDLSSNEISSIADNSLESLGELLTLDLNGNKIVSLKDLTFITMSKLKILILGGNKISVLKDDMFSGLSEFRFSLPEFRVKWTVFIIRLKPC